MELSPGTLQILLGSLAVICFLCAWLVPRWLRRRWETKLKQKDKQDPIEDVGKYVTLGELPAWYLDRALGKVAEHIIAETKLTIWELREAMWQILLIFLGIIIALVALITPAIT